jgi:hypothetical protein
MIVSTAKAMAISGIGLAVYLFFRNDFPVTRRGLVVAALTVIAISPALLIALSFFSDIPRAPVQWLASMLGGYTNLVLVTIALFAIGIAESACYRRELHSHTTLADDDSYETDMPLADSLNGPMEALRACDPAGIASMDYDS